MSGKNFESVCSIFGGETGTVTESMRVNVPQTVEMYPFLLIVPLTGQQ